VLHQAPLQLNVCNLSLGRRHLLNTYEVKAVFLPLTGLYISSTYSSHQSKFPHCHSVRLFSYSHCHQLVVRRWIHGIISHESSDVVCQQNIWRRRLHLSMDVQQTKTDSIQ